MKRKPESKPVNPNNYDSRRAQALAELARKREAERKAAAAKKVEEPPVEEQRQ